MKSNKTQPLVSIIIPVFNLQDYIGYTIDSILSQDDYSNFEILIVDDHSIDNTINVLKEYAGIDQRIKILINNRKKGVSGGRNTGIENAKGEWVIFLDGDDLWEPETLNTQISVLEQFPKAQLISSDFYVLEENNKKLLNTDIDEDYKKYFSNANKTGELLRLDNPASCFLNDKVVTRTGILLIKQKLIKKVGFFDESLDLWEDQLFWLKLAMCVEYMIYIPKPLMIYRHRKGSLTRRGLPGTIWAVIALKKLLELKEFNPYKYYIIEKIRYYILENTYFYRKNGNKLKAIQSSFDGLIYAPKKLTSWKSFFASLCLI